ncbi:MAG: M15 family metallopeptidase [Bacilli bacterium]|nr:M15 family metallopeptidase [Bacilli bacterium]
MKKYFILILLMLFIKGDTIMNFYENVKQVKNPSDILVLVNKNNRLDKSYVPYDLSNIDTKYANENKMVRKEAKEAFEALSEEAAKEGYRVIAVSTYRSYDYQENLYNYYVETKGLAYADACSARKGHSEHQTGLSIDVEGSTGTYDEFGETKDFIWMKDHAHLYGFILRYPEDKTYITGFKYEPWHYRYVGKKAAKEIYDKKITLEEYLDKIH